MKLSNEQKQYIKEHPKESAFAMAKKLGCSTQSVYYYLHLYHGNGFLEVKKKEKEYKHKVVMELYPTHSSTEIGKILGITRSAVNNMAHRLGVKHNEDLLDVLAHRYSEKSKEKDVQKKRIASLKETLRKEKIRFTYGLPQKTKRRFKTIPNRCFNARNYLVRRYNYFYDVSIGELLTIFYDSETRRLPHDREKYYVERYGIKIEQAG